MPVTIKVSNALKNYWSLFKE